MVVEDRERDTQLASLLLGAFRGGDSDDVGQLTGLEEVAQLGDDECGGGASAEAKDHPGLDILNGLVSGKLLEFVLGEGWSGEGFDGEGFVGLGA